MKKIIIILFLFSLGKMKAQNTLQEWGAYLEKCTTALNAKTPYRSDGKMSLYTDTPQNSDSLLQEMTTSVWWSDDEHYRYLMGTNETLNDGKELLIINHDKKSYNRHTFEKRPKNAGGAIDLKAMEAFMVSVQTETAKDGTKIHTVKLKESYPYSQYVVFTNSDFIITKIVLYAAQTQEFIMEDNSKRYYKPRLEVVYEYSFSDAAVLKQLKMDEVIKNELRAYEFLR